MPYADDVSNLWNQAQAQQGAGLGPVQVPGRAPPQLVPPAQLAQPPGAPMGPAGLPAGMDPRSFGPATNPDPDAPLTPAQQQMQNRAEWASAATGAPPAPPPMSHQAQRKLDEQVDHERERLAKEGKLAAPPGTPNPFAAARAAGAGGPGAAPFDATAAGYRALGDNPNDPRQAAARAAYLQEQAGTAGVTVAGAKEQAEAAAKIEEFRRQEQQRQRDEMIANAKAAQDQANYVKTTQDHYKERAADLAAQKIDPDQIYRGAAGGFRRVVAGIGAALGAVGATFGHTQNFAQEIVDSQVKNSIAAQQANMENKRAGVEAAKGEYQMAREAGMDHAQAAAVQRGLGNQLAAQTADELAQKATSVQQRNAAMQMAQKFREEQAKAEYEHTTAANAKGFELAEQRRKEGMAAAANARKADVAEAKVDADEATATAASRALHEQINETGGVEGFGVLGRAGRAISPLLTTEQTRADLRNLDRLAASEAKDEKGRVNPEIKADILKNVRTEEDVKRFLSENDYRHKIVREAARRGALPSSAAKPSGEEGSE